MSLKSGHTPTQLKQAIVKPKLKDSLSSSEFLNSFRPISNSKAISKIIEKAVACQLNDYLTENHLSETLQSAQQHSYKRFHSTETALLKVRDNILQAIDNLEMCCAPVIRPFGCVRHSRPSAAY